MQLPLCGNVYDDVTDFEICGFHKNTKIYRHLEKETLVFLQMKKLKINYTSRATLFQKNSFLAVVTFQSHTTYYYLFQLVFLKEYFYKTTRLYSNVVTTMFD